uniref:Uncharacterized protein n=1 Tax=Arundo donax TaxID=35708 RepID=A0A0A9GIH6_ARUDO
MYYCHQSSVIEKKVSGKHTSKRRTTSRQDTSFNPELNCIYWTDIKSTGWPLLGSREAWRFICEQFEFHHTIGSYSHCYIFVKTICQAES